MNKVLINGGLGEQMFQYAFFLALRKKCKGAVEPIGGDKLSKYFSLPIAMSEKVNLLSRFGLSGFSKGAKKIYDGTYDSVVFNCEDTTFQGEWASPNYFSPVADEVANLFTVSSNKLPNDCNEIIEQITSSSRETVVVHIFEPLKKTNTCTTDYYNWSIAHLRTFIPDVQFVVLSDCSDLVSKKLLLPEDTIWISTKNMDEFSQLQIMLRANHQICSNTFLAWWAAWLNPNQDKIVIVPQKWSWTGTTHSNLIPLYWIAIPVT